MSAVRVGGGLTEWFAMIIGVMQGCILLPLLFKILLEVVMALIAGSLASRYLKPASQIFDLRLISVYLRTVKANFSSLWTECTLPAAGLGWLSVIPRLKHNALDVIVRY